MKSVKNRQVLSNWIFAKQLLGDWILISSYLPYQGSDQSNQVRSLFYGSAERVLPCVRASVTLPGPGESQSGTAPLIGEQANAIPTDSNNHWNCSILLIGTLSGINCPLPVIILYTSKRCNRCESHKADAKHCSTHGILIQEVIAFWQRRGDKVQTRCKAVKQ